MLQRTVSGNHDSQEQGDTHGPGNGLVREHDRQPSAVDASRHGDRLPLDRNHRSGASNAVHDANLGFAGSCIDPRQRVAL